LTSNLIPLYNCITENLNCIIFSFLTWITELFYWIPHSKAISRIARLHCSNIKGFVNQVSLVLMSSLISQSILSTNFFILFILYIQTFPSEHKITFLLVPSSHVPILLFATALSLHRQLIQNYVNLVIPHLSCLLSPLQS
jgi:hypothetical protein